jgi:hypothetical protein
MSFPIWNLCPSFRHLCLFGYVGLKNIIHSSGYHEKKVTLQYPACLHFPSFLVLWCLRDYPSVLSISLLFRAVQIHHVDILWRDNLAQRG